MTLQLHRPDGDGGLEAHPSEPEWQAQLRSPVWGSGQWPLSQATWPEKSVIDLLSSGPLATSKMTTLPPSLG